MQQPLQHALRPIHPFNNSATNHVRISNASRPWQLARRQETNASPLQIGQAIVKRVVITRTGEFNASTRRFLAEVMT